MPDIIQLLGTVILLFVALILVGALLPAITDPLVAHNASGTGADGKGNYTGAPYVVGSLLPLIFLIVIVVIIVGGILLKQLPGTKD